MLYIGIDVAKQSHVAAVIDGDEMVIVVPFVRQYAEESERLSRQLAHHRFELVLELAALKNRVTAVLDRAFPEYERLFADRFGPTSRAPQGMRDAREHAAGGPGALAALIAGKIGDAWRFETPSKLVAYAGMDATKQVSGESLDSPEHLSKRGSPYLRWAPCRGRTAPAGSTRTSGGCYARKIAQGKHHCVALAAIARKLSGVRLTLMKESGGWSPEPPTGYLPGHLSQKERSFKPLIPYPVLKIPIENSGIGIDSL